MTTTVTPEHTCHGAIFCGAPRAAAVSECPACTPAPVAEDRDFYDALLDSVPAETEDRRVAW
jgi:hypothetical protein